MIVAQKIPDLSIGGVGFRIGRLNLRLSKPNIHGATHRKAGPVNAKERRRCETPLTYCLPIGMFYSNIGIGQVYLESTR